jgi:multicomponent Na+:H+ antiporter subunit E
MNPVTVALAWLRLLGLFFRELVVSVKDVAIAVLSPRRPLRAAIVAVPLDVQSEAGITLLANMITLTPGTTTLHVAEDRSVLYIHVLNVTPDTIRQLKDGFERGVMEVLR